MKIVDHRLLEDDGTPVAFVESPNVGGAVEHAFLVMHYTAGRNAKQSIAWLTKREARASAHIVVARNGTITQLVPFDRIAWHAGSSEWLGRAGLNRYSLGIEMDNAGRLTRQGDRWRAWFGDEYAAEDVVEATHKHESAASGWHAYSPDQIDATLEVASLLFNHYGLRDVLGHEDIAPGRKTDPGPAFPMASFRARIVGRSEDEPSEQRLLRLRTPFMQGEDVREVQEALANSGIDVDKDGVFGPATARAVTGFQREGGLTADGIVGPATRAALGL